MASHNPQPGPHRRLPDTIERPAPRQDLKHPEINWGSLEAWLCAQPRRGYRPSTLAWFLLDRLRGLDQVLCANRANRIRSLSESWTGLENEGAGEHIRRKSCLEPERPSRCEFCPQRQRKVFVAEIFRSRRSLSVGRSCPNANRRSDLMSRRHPLRRPGLPMR